MKRASMWGILLFVFIVGVFFGIWMDWSAWRHQVATHNIVYQVQNYPEANLVVHGGDTITLVTPQGDNSGILMNFQGSLPYNPCANAVSDTNGINPCIIKEDAPPGSYFFSCSSTQNSGQNYSCDPGVQQSPGGPLMHFTLTDFVARDFRHLLGLHHAPVTPPPPPPGPVRPANTNIGANVTCSAAGKTQVLAPGGGDLTTINASYGETVFWFSTQSFSLDASKLPSGLCSSDPSSPGTKNAQCVVGQNKLSGQYTITALTPSSCTPLVATLNANQNANH